MIMLLYVLCIFVISCNKKETHNNNRILISTKNIKCDQWEKNPNQQVLFSALLKDCENVFDKYIALNGDLNIYNNNGTTLTNMAVSLGNINILVKLLQNGANPNLRDKNIVSAQSTHTPFRFSG